MADQSLKSSRLKKIFTGVISGNRAIKNRNDAELFLESICDQEDRSSCIERLVGASEGLQALKIALRSDISTHFINEHSAKFLIYISVDSVRQLCCGQLTQEILAVVVEPPTFWNQFKEYYEKKALSPTGIRAFACTLLELLTIPPPSVQLDLIEIANKAISDGGGLLDSSDAETRSLAYKVQDAVRNRVSGDSTFGIFKPGGRHDNDFEDFRQIDIFPTKDEFMAKDQPFYLPAEVVFGMEPDQRKRAHLDNQFRLLREDMLAELRDDLPISISPEKKQKRRNALRLKSLVFKSIHCGEGQRYRPASLALRCYKGLPDLENKTPKQRKKFYSETRIFPNGNSFGCLLCANEIVAFATVDKNEDLLAENPPVILLQIFGKTAMIKTLNKLKTMNQEQLEFVLVGTPFFAFEPILRCLQELHSLPLSDELLGLGNQDHVSESPFAPKHLLQKIKENIGCDMRHILGLPKDKKVILDKSQSESLIASLSQAVSLIQGPPGTGKSFIGAILAKALLEHSKENILVLCYTNHALDQFLEDIMNIGVSVDHMLRLGSKSSTRTKQLGLYEQSVNYRRTQECWNLLNKYSNRCKHLENKIKDKAAAFRRLKLNRIEDILDYLKYVDDSMDFISALSVPKSEDGLDIVDRKGKKIGSSYLLDRWLQGKDAGVFQKSVGGEHKDVWGMKKLSRLECFQKWTCDFFQEQAVLLQDLISEYSDSYEKLNAARDQKSASIITKRRIIGCTTTAAAKYKRELLNAKPGIIIVEEAGEILESHILTALSVNTKHLVLIGDHKQLRPKVNNYALTLERGDGYNLNVSLFERLVQSGYPHTTLAKQHRMRPEISSLVRNLTYPDLQDGPKTLNRPNIRGLQSNVIFINHEYPEADANELADRRDEGAKVSRQNVFEVQMVLKIVRYLAQQGYGTDQQVVLTPYLGQLRLLMNSLKKDHDPVLNDLDSHDLVRAGLLPSASASSSKRALRISTIDNYQGEESDIVIASLTRSNSNGDIGFMVAPQRLNVLLSRARDGLIIIGNVNTFKKSRKGKEVWVPFIDQLSKGGGLHDGLPVKCERHPDKLALLKKPEDFDADCPDGGCAESCSAMLSCNLHKCPQRCHQLSDHSKVRCLKIVQDTCPQNHKSKRECWISPTPCVKCEAEAKRREEIRARDHKIELERQAKEAEYAKRLAEIDADIAHEKRLQKDHEDQLNRERVLQQRRKDLAAARLHGKQPRATEKLIAKDLNRITDTQKATETIQGKIDSTDDSESSDEDESYEQPDISQAEADWEYQKKFEKADNEHLDTLMGMIGLESVKQQVLTIKTKIDTQVRQRANIKDERFGVALLGNPGTGKTTVARLYAQFLASVAVLPGTTVRETTGSRLASEGVDKCKALIEGVLNDGGGAIFIDEAYQLVSTANFGGSQVLDFLLAEVENLTGKIVFILAGYNRQMEKFFAHNPGLPSRFPHEFQFQDYEDTELLKIFQYQLTKRFQGRMKAEGGIKGLFCRIVARRVGYGRGHEGFGNARAVENALARILSRQAVRLKREMRAGKLPDEMLLTKEDLIGPEPSNALESNKSWKKLKLLTGLTVVKESVKTLFDTIQYNYERELEEKPLLQFNLNRVFLGSPGTGKTTVAKLYGQILADIGFLSSGEVVVKNPSDFVGDVLGGSEKNTKGILASTVGKVLIIDEAYGLHGGSGGDGGGPRTDPYKEAVIDTIVAEVQSVPGDNRCVILIGYKDQMEGMFQNVNPGLSRRFPISEAFEFEDFTQDELEKILSLKLNQQAYSATPQAIGVAMEVLKRARNRPNFGNAGEVDILLNGAKARHQQRRARQKLPHVARLEAVDMDPDYDRGDRASTNINMLFKDVIGCGEVIARLEGIQKTVANMKARNMDPHDQIPFNFLFRGPPGTGKTTTARKMGKIYYDMGFLSTAEVVEVSATNLVGQYVGQTGPKTQKLLEKALGKVLFIDEAYRLAEGNFAKEAMDEIVDCLTKPKFSQKLVVILAGYEEDINRLMSINPGLTSRFPETLVFRSLNPRECMNLFKSLLGKKKHVNAAVLEESSTFQDEVLHRFEKLTSLANWANARDINTLVKSVFNHLLRTADPLSSNLMSIEKASVLATFDDMITERSKRAKQAFPDISLYPRYPMQTETPEAHPPPPASVSRTQQTQVTPESENLQQQKVSSPEDSPSNEPADCRDQGVEDEVWAQLQLDKHAAEIREKRYYTLLKMKADLEAEAEAARKQKVEDMRLEEQRKEEERQTQLCVEAKEKEWGKLERERIDREREQERLEQERIQRELARRKLEEELRKLEEERKKEALAQKKLRSLGVCMAGFRWIKQAAGYRCAGGGHYISDAALGLE